MVKGRIKHRDLRHIRAKELASSQNAFQVLGIVERGEVNAFADSCEHFVCDQRRFRKQLAAMHHPMSHRLNGGKAQQTPPVRANPVEHALYCRAYVGYSLLPAMLRLATLNRELGFRSNAIDSTTAQALVAPFLDAVEIRVDQLKF
jgi:hypothetical protein